VSGGHDDAADQQQPVVLTFAHPQCAKPVTTWPNLFIVGVARAGTTSLASYLDQHPAIFMAPIKEPYFFTRYHPHWVSVPHDESAYLGLFRQGGGARYRGEATPAYFWDSESAHAIRSTSPDARIVISLREPIDRALSEYLLLRRTIYETRSSFLDVVSQELQMSNDIRGDDPRDNYVARGLYAEGVSRYFATFGRDRVHVVFFEEFVRDPRSEMRNLYAFLGVDTNWASRITVTVKNRGGVPRNKLAERLLYSPQARDVARWTLPPALRQRLESALMRPADPSIEMAARRILEPFYAPDWRQLEDLLGRPVPWTRQQADCR
jgi:Sulfotransferase family